MPVTSVEKDLDALTMTIVADFPVSVRRLWDAYVDPRQIEKFWGPVGWPATFTRHDVTPGGFSHYYMSGPEGERSPGYWEWLTVDPGRSFEVLDGFTGDDGEPNRDMPTTRMAMAFSGDKAASRLTTTTFFNSLEELEKLLEMGVEEGTRSAMSQIDDVVADLASFAADLRAESKVLSDTSVRVARVIRGGVDDVWRAHTEPELLRRWQLGPEGWTMPVCEVATSVGDTYRYEWERQDAGEERFGFEGELIEVAPPHRSVTLERMIGVPGPGIRNELTLTEVEGGTLLSIVMIFPDAETRDTVLGTGMVDGMESSYARLESEVLTAA